MRLTLFLATTCAFVSAQLTGHVGPVTSTEAKRTVICNVLDYGGQVGSSDIGPAISKAFDNCVRKHPEGSTLYVPAGSYSMSTWVNLNHGKKWAFQLDGVITRTSNKGGHMIAVQYTYDFEFYSSTSAGGIQGQGYLARNAGPRFLRVVKSSDFSIHDVIFVDSPEFHLIIEKCSNGELYNLMIRGADIGESDGIDVSGKNMWVHDVEVTNRDECVTVKSPSSNILIENIWCNQSGGCAIGSLSAGTVISDITYRNVYSNGGEHMLMIKSNGGSGYVQNVLLENFLAHGTAFGLNIDQYWHIRKAGIGNGVQIRNITAQDWKGTIVDGEKRPTIRFWCADLAPCMGMTVKNVQIWSQTGPQRASCRSAWGWGSCLRQGAGGQYGTTAVAVNMSGIPADLATMDGDLKTGFSPTKPIPMPSTIPITFFPGVPQISPLAVAVKKAK